MSKFTVYIAITNHGFGHGVRAASVAAKIQELCPEIQLIFATTAPRWLLESYVTGDFIYHPQIFDVGVIQSDSLTMDKQGTLEKLKEIKFHQSEIIEKEVKFLQENQVNLILADIPPLVAPLAKSAGIPCWMMSNFGWDFIYEEWGGEFTAIADWIRECFQQCDCLFRLPLYESMSAFPHRIETGLTGGDPRYDLDQLRENFNIHTPPEKTVMLTFGGLGLEQIPYENLSRFPDWLFLTFDFAAPPLPNLISIRTHPQAKLLPIPGRPVDFMPLCGRIISKPGYSTFAEALRLEIPLISLIREGFAEAPILLEGIANYGFHKIITPENFFAGDWQFLREPMTPPRSSQILDKNGSKFIAQSVINYLQS